MSFISSLRAPSDVSALFTSSAVDDIPRKAASFTCASSQGVMRWRRSGWTRFSRSDVATNGSDMKLRTWPVRAIAKWVVCSSCCAAAEHAASVSRSSLGVQGDPPRGANEWHKGRRRERDRMSHLMIEGQELIPLSYGCTVRFSILGGKGNFYGTEDPIVRDRSRGRG